MGDEYSMDGITVLSGLEAIRKRPGMYVGKGKDGYHQLLWFAIDAAVEHLKPNDRDRELCIVLLDNRLVDVINTISGYSSEPVSSKYYDGKSLLEIMCTTLPCPGRCELAIVNALSSFMWVNTHCKRWSSMEFSRGKITEQLSDLGPTDIAGTAVRFCPDRDIFKKIKFDKSLIVNHLSDIKNSRPNLLIRFIDNDANVTNF